MLKKWRAATMTHDDKRHGTTTLFAAMSRLDGFGDLALRSASGRPRAWLSAWQKIWVVYQARTLSVIAELPEAQSCAMHP